MLSTQQIQTELDKLERDLHPIDNELDQLYAAFGTALPASVEAWMNRSIQRRIEENAEKVIAEGIEHLRQIKIDLNDLIGRLPDICTSSLGDKSEWPHRKKDVPRPGHQTSSSESHAAATFRIVISHLGVLLAKYDLIKEKTGHIAEWVNAGNGNFRYAINPGFDERNFPSLLQYKKARSKQAELCYSIDVKKKELEISKARDLWNQA